MYNNYLDYLKKLNNSLTRNGIHLDVDLTVSKDAISEQVGVFESFFFVNNILLISGSINVYRDSYIQNSLSYLRQEIFDEYQDIWDEELKGLTVQPVNAGKVEKDVKQISLEEISNFTKGVGLVSSTNEGFDSASQYEITMDDDVNTIEPLSEYSEGLELYGAGRSGIEIDDDEDDFEYEYEEEDDSDEYEEESDDFEYEYEEDESEEESDDYEYEYEEEDDSDEYEEESDDYEYEYEEEDSEEEVDDSTDYEYEEEEDYEYEEESDDYEYEEESDDYEYEEESDDYEYEEESDDYEYEEESDDYEYEEESDDYEYEEEDSDDYEYEEESDDYEYEEESDNYEYEEESDDYEYEEESDDYEYEEESDDYGYEEEDDVSISDFIPKDTQSSVQKPTTLKSPVQVKNLHQQPDTMAESLIKGVNKLYGKGKKYLYNNGGKSNEN